MPMNNRLLVPQKLPLLLDYAPGAAAAYSLRSLSNSYVGPVVTVRRSTDNAEADFTATEVSDGTLAAWCGGGDGFVKVWWDQSGNSRHASNSTAAYQPRIVASGETVIDSNTGKPSLEFKPGAATQSYLTFDRVQNVYALFLVARVSAAGNQHLACRDATASDLRGLSLRTATDDGSGKMYMQQIGPFPPTHGFINDVNETHLFHIATNGTSCQYGMDGAVAAPVAETDMISVSQLGTYHIAAYALKGYMSEFLAYTSDMTALRTRIEGDLAWYY